MMAGRGIDRQAHRGALARIECNLLEGDQPLRRLTSLRRQAEIKLRYLRSASSARILQRELDRYRLRAIRELGRHGQVRHDEGGVRKAMAERKSGRHTVCVVPAIADVEA